MKISDLSEFELIERLTQISGVKKSDTTLIGVGDDAAALSIDASKTLLISTDTLVEDVHFKTAFTTARQLGRKALAVNISDIAAMGAAPKRYLVSVSLPGTTRLEFIEDLYHGLKDMSDQFSVEMIGGDTTASEKIFINITILGEAKKGAALSRSGARAGDQIFVTGVVGASAAGLALLKRGICPDAATAFERQLINSHLTPAPRVNEACFISQNHLATAMMDLSDGIAGDLNHICRKSGVGANVYLNQLPLPRNYEQKTFDLDPHLPVTGGEDYELLFTAVPDKTSIIQNAPQLQGAGITCIGEICEGGAVTFFNAENKPVKINKSGFDHYRS